MFVSDQCEVIEIMTVRPVMATEALANEDDTSMANAEEQANGVNIDEPGDAMPPGGNTIRSRGSKVSNLRAAFEQAGNGRPLSSDKRAITPNGKTGVDVEITRLRDVMAKEQELREAERLRIVALEEENEALKQQLNAQEETHMQGVNGSDAQAHVQAASDRAERAQEEVLSLRSQLGELKRSIATNTRIESHEMTDSAFQGEFGTLSYQLQDWVVNSFRKTKVEKTVEEMTAAVDSLGDDLPRHLLRPLFERWDSSAKLVLLQAVTVSLLMSIFSDPMPFGLPSNLTWSDAVRSASEELQGVLDSQAYNRWRAMTFDIICHSEAISPFVHSAANKVTSTISTILADVCSIEVTESQADSLRNVVRRVIAVSHSLRVQRSPYEVHLPLVGSDFDSETMELFSDDQDDLGDDYKIRCSVFPTVFKPCSEASPNVVFKARVS